MNLILLGAPGAGKGTQAEILCEKLNIPAISTGAIIRDAIKNKTEMGLKASEYTKTGALVPDDVVIGIIKERLSQEDCKAGFILDGFPRTIAQAEALDNMGVVIEKAVSIEVPEEVIIRRMAGRRVCDKCGATYHIVTMPSKDNVHCDKCGGNLGLRKDDEPETVLKRLTVYHQQTEPLKGFYKNKGICMEVDGTLPLPEITERIVTYLKQADESI